MARKKSRIDIPSDLAADVLFLANRTCCICRQQGKPVQIHHIDDNPSNNSEKNLAILCFDCHRETQIRGGFDRKLNANQVILYRDDWHKVVAQQRATVNMAESDIIPTEPMRVVESKAPQQKQKRMPPAPQLDMLRFKKKTVEIDNLRVSTLGIPFRNNSGVTIKDIAAQIRFENTNTSESRDVNYGFWAEAEGKRISLNNGDTGHIALVSVERYQIATLDNKWTRRYLTAYCEKRPLPNGIWRVEIELIGINFRQSILPFKIEVSEGGVFRVREQETV